MSWLPNLTIFSADSIYIHVPHINNASFPAFFLRYPPTNIWIPSKVPNHRNWLVVYLPLWKIWVRQLGWWHSQLNGKSKNSMVPVTTSQINHYLSVISPYLWWQNPIHHIFEVKFPAFSWLNPSFPLGSSLHWFSTPVPTSSWHCQPSRLTW